MTSHPHAALMAEYAKDALLSETPWTLWEYALHNATNFHPCEDHPGWHPERRYRRKKVSIFIGHNVVPKPLSKIEDGTQVYCVAPHAIEFFFPLIFNSKDPWEKGSLNRGLLHETKEDAVTHAKALIAFTKPLT